MDLVPLNGLPLSGLSKREAPNIADSMCQGGGMLVGRRLHPLRGEGEEVEKGLCEEGRGAGSSGQEVK